MGSHDIMLFSAKKSQTFVQLEDHFGMEEVFCCHSIRGSCNRVGFKISGAPRIKIVSTKGHTRRLILTRVKTLNHGSLIENNTTLFNSGTHC